MSGLVIQIADTWSPEKEEERFQVFSAECNSLFMPIVSSEHS
jgi:hypothetical protein